MKSHLQAGPHERVSVPPEKRFLIRSKPLVTKENLRNLVIGIIASLIAGVIYNVIASKINAFQQFLSNWLTPATMAGIAVVIGLGTWWIIRRYFPGSLRRLWGFGILPFLVFFSAIALIIVKPGVPVIFEVADPGGSNINVALEDDGTAVRVNYNGGMTPEYLRLSSSNLLVDFQRITLRMLNVGNAGAFVRVEVDGTECMPVPPAKVNQRKFTRVGQKENVSFDLPKPIYGQARNSTEWTFSFLETPLNKAELRVFAK